MHEQHQVSQMCIYPSKAPALTQDELFREIFSNNLNEGSSLKTNRTVPPSVMLLTFQWETKQAPGLSARRACMRTIS